MSVGRFRPEIRTSSINIEKYLLLWSANERFDVILQRSTLTRYDFA